MTTLELTVGPVAHGGHCVAHQDAPDNRVVFVRHALPGERVRAVVTEERASYLRADAVEILTASADRVPAPCPHAGPGRCGGCDWQHVTPEAQRRLKEHVVREQLARLAGLSDVAVQVQPLPGGPLGWRTRVRYAVDGSGRAGLRRHRSHEIEPVQQCLIASAGVAGLGVPGRTWPGATAVEAVVSSCGDKALLIEARSEAQDGPVPAGSALADDVAVLRRTDRGVRRMHGHRAVRERAVGRTFRVGVAGFWQVHPAAADALAAAVLEDLSPRPGESALDLYSGVGLFAAALAPWLGPSGSLTLVEADRAACEDARYNLRTVAPSVRIERGRVERLLGPSARRRAAVVRSADLVVLDPPRSGAGAGVVQAVAALEPRAVAYVACDPAALARDLASFDRLGYRLDGLRAYDLFPMTHHVECVARLTPWRA